MCRWQTPLPALFIRPSPYPPGWWGRVCRRVGWGGRGKKWKKLVLQVMRWLKFLFDYTEFGCKAHFLAASSLYSSFLSSEDMDYKKILAVKIFSEFMSLLEDIGALAIAIRHRDDGVGILYSFLTYGNNSTYSPPTTISKIYQLLISGNEFRRCSPTSEI